MRQRDTYRERLRVLIEAVRKYRTLVVTLSALVVFVTTYMLILPAFTLDEDEAAQQGGIDVPFAENVIDEQNSDGAEAAAGESQAGTLTSTSKEFTVSLDYDKESGLSEDTALNAEEILDVKGHKKEFKEYQDKAKAAVKEKTGRSVDLEMARFFDISLEDQSGQIEPSGNVDVFVDLADQKAVSGDGDFYIIHFTENEKTGKLEAAVLDDEDSGFDVKKSKLRGASFTADSFSVYGIVYTVDLHYDVDGESYDFSFPGGGAVTLSDLVRALKITDGDVQEFIAGVDNVEFSDPDLVWVGKVDEDTTVGALKDEKKLEVEYSAELTDEQIDEIDKGKVHAGDWALISMKPFESEETVTVTMENGEVFVIQVTDSNFASSVDGKTFALIVANNDNTSGHAIESTIRDDKRLTSRSTTINYLGATVNEEVYFCENVNSIKWTFEYIKGTGNQFKLKAANGQYLHYADGQGFSLSNEPTILYADVMPGDNDHVRLCIDEQLHNAINLYNGSNGFGIWGSGNNDPNEKLTLCKPYDMSSGTPGTISTVDNDAEGITLKLFDYDYITTPGTTGDLDKDGNKVVDNQQSKNDSHFNSSVNQGKKLWFLGWGSDSNESDPAINDFTGLDTNIRALQGVVKNNLSGGYPQLAVDQSGNATDESLAYLFDGSAADTKTYTANHLFEKIGDKYSYDSNKHYAEFNTSTNNFTVYDGTLEQNSGSNQQWKKNDKAVGFFPFDSYANMKGLYDSNRLYLNPNVDESDQKKSDGQHYRMNHHNGMSLDAYFRLPENGKDSYGNDIEFEFSGDDDLWVFIDDVLVLDIGGVHQPLNGKINFTTGDVKVDKAVTAKGADSSKVAGANTTIEEMFRKAGKTYDPEARHEMKVFWLERGGCDSNCKIEFNLPLLTQKTGDVSFTKKEAPATDGQHVTTNAGLKGAQFTLYTDEECTTPLKLANVPVTATSQGGDKELGKVELLYHTCGHLLHEGNEAACRLQSRRYCI